MELFSIGTGTTRPTTPPVAATRDYWQALAADGFVELIREPSSGAPLGYAEPVIETRNGRQVAVAYALGTPEERHAEEVRRMRETLEVSPFQARAALASMGMLSQVDALMTAPDTPEVARLAWLHAQTFRRLSPTILGMAQVLNLSDENLDNLFLLALGIEA